MSDKLLFFLSALHVIPLMFLATGAMYRGWFDLGMNPKDSDDVAFAIFLIALSAIAWPITDVVLFFYALHRLFKFILKRDDT